MNISPLLGRFAIVGDRKGIVVALAPVDQMYSSNTAAATTLVIGPPAQPVTVQWWNLLVLVDDKLEVWPAHSVRVE